MVSIMTCNSLYDHGNIYHLLSAIVPASPPSNVTTAALSSTSIQVNWDEVPAIDQNGIITQYEVEYNQSTFDSVPTIQNMTVNSTMAVLTGLQEYVEYSIRVRAYTSEGPGPYSDDEIQRTEEDGMYQYL